MPSSIINSNDNMKTVASLLNTANQACTNDGADDEALRTCKKQVDIAIRLLNALTTEVKEEEPAHQPATVESAPAVVPVSQEPQKLQEATGPQSHRLDYTCLKDMTPESIAAFFDQDGADIMFELEQAKLHPWFPSFVSYVMSNGADDDWEFGTLTAKKTGKLGAAGVGVCIFFPTYYVWLLLPTFRVGAMCG